MSVCEICGTKLAGSKDGYASHIKRYHSVTAGKQSVHGELAERIVLEKVSGDGSTGRMGYATCLPQRTSGKSVERITQELEWSLGRAIIPDTRPVKF